MESMIYNDMKKNKEYRKHLRTYTQQAIKVLEIANDRLFLKVLHEKRSRIELRENR